MICLEARDEMPAWEKEVEEALSEGIMLENSWGPRHLMISNQKITGVEFMSCTQVFDMEGRFNPVYDDQVRQKFNCDTLLISIGQAPDLSFLSEDEGLERAVWGTLQVNENTLATNIPQIFAGGDFTAGPTFVIRAVASGRRAALAIAKYLKGDKSRVEIPDEKSALGQDDQLLSQQEAEAPLTGRVPIAIEEARERVSDFREVESGYSEEQARNEARRCLRCDLEGE
jgi:NADH-quinone oxidoreductase subunit F